jgi:hypothetical protein
MTLSRNAAFHPTPPPDDVTAPPKAVTEYHYILLHPDRLMAVNQARSARSNLRF